MLKTLISEIAAVIDAYRRASSPHFNGSPDAARNHVLRLHELSRRLPSGSGIDNGCLIEIPGEGADTEIVKISIPYHHMNDVGSYVGWNTYQATVTPSLVSGFDVDVDVDVAGDDPEIDSTCEYLADVLRDALAQPIDEAQAQAQAQRSLAHQARVGGEWAEAILPVGFSAHDGATADTVAHVYARLVGLTCWLFTDAPLGAPAAGVQVKVNGFSVGTDQRPRITVQRINDDGQTTHEPTTLRFCDVRALLVQ